MNKITKLIFLVIFLLLIFSLKVTAQTPSSLQSQEVILDEKVSIDDLQIKEPKILPDSPFYFFKDWGRKLRLFFTLDPVKKANLSLRFASEKLWEAKKIAEKKGKEEVLRKAIENYEKELEKIKGISSKIKKKANKDPKVASFLDKFIKHQILHERILENLQEKVPPQAFEKIKKARERHLKRFKEVMEKLEDKDKIPERIEKNLKKIKGSKFKEIKSYLFIKKLEKISPEYKEKFKKVKEELLKKAKEKIEALPEEKKEKIKDYIEKIKGTDEGKLEILENLKEELKENKKIKEKLIEARLKILEKAKKKLKKMNCPEIEKPAPDFCKEGRIIVQKDEKGCIISFKCVIPAKVILPSKSKKVCIALWDPVCGKDGETYSNECFAKLAGVEIAHKGICEKVEKKFKECEKHEDCGLSCPGIIPPEKCTVKLSRYRCFKGKCIISVDCKTDKDCKSIPCGPSGAPCVAEEYGKCINGICLIKEFHEEYFPEFFK